MIQNDMQYETMYDNTIFKPKPKFQTSKILNMHSPVLISTYTRLPNYTVLIVVLSKLHATSHHQKHGNQVYLQQVLVDQYNSN